MTRSRFSLTGFIAGRPETSGTVPAKNRKETPMAITLGTFTQLEEPDVG